MDNIPSLELRYADLHLKLIAKINRLQYLQQRHQLRLQLEQDIKNEYQRVSETYSDVIREGETLESLIQVQNDAIKTQDLLGRYLHSVVPTLRAIHQKQATPTETLIHANLESMYGLESGSLATLVQSAKDLNQLSADAIAKQFEVNDVVKDLVIPQMEVFYNDTQKLQKVRQEYLKAKKLLIQENQQEFTLSEPDIRAAVSTLLKSWSHLSVLSQLLPTLISSLPINWAADFELLRIIHQCEIVQAALERNQQVITEPMLRDMPYGDLLLIDFGELSMQLFTEEE